MKFLIQRVTKAQVDIDGQTVGKIDNKGFLVLIGVGEGDTREIADRFIKKMLALRIFADENGKTNLSIKDVGGSLLLVSQFTMPIAIRAIVRRSMELVTRHLPMSFTSTSLNSANKKLPMSKPENSVPICK